MKFESKRNCRREQLSMNVDPVDTDRDTYYISHLIIWLPIRLHRIKQIKNQSFCCDKFGFEILVRLIKLQFGRYEFHQFNFDRNKFWMCCYISYVRFFSNADSWAESVFVLRVVRLCFVVIVRRNESSWKLSGGNKSV